MQKRFKAVLVSCPLTGHQREVSPGFAARITGRSLRTAQRWTAGARMDKASRQLLQMRVFGVIPWGAWQSFRVRDSFIENVDTGETWTPEQLRGAWIRFQQLREYQRPATGTPARRMRIIKR